MNYIQHSVFLLVSSFGFDLFYEEGSIKSCTLLRKKSQTIRNIPKKSQNSQFLYALWRSYSLIAILHQVSPIHDIKFHHTQSLYLKFRCCRLFVPWVTSPFFTWTPTAHPVYLGLIYSTTWYLPSLAQWMIQRALKIHLPPLFSTGVHKRSYLTHV